MGRRQGEGRGLEAFEVAIIKNLGRRNKPRDYIMSLFVHPGRVISPAAVDEVKKGRIGADIEAASDGDTDLFVQRRLAETRPLSERDFGNPVSQIRVSAVLRATTTERGLFSTYENRLVEFKEFPPAPSNERGKIAKTMAAYANTGGGYVFFGIKDNHQIVGLVEPEKFQKYCDSVSDILTSHFSPVIEWDKNIVSFRGHQIGVIYVYQCQRRPVVAMREAGEIKRSAIYFRYEGKSQVIEPGDLLDLIAEIRRVAALDAYAGQAQDPGATFGT